MLSVSRSEDRSEVLADEMKIFLTVLFSKMRATYFAFSRSMPLTKRSSETTVYIEMG